MKKLFSLVLAVAMVMSLSAVAFADVGTALQIWGINDDEYLTESDGVLNKAVPIATPIPFGKTAYFALFCADNGKTTVPSQAVVDYDVVKGIKPKLTYEMGSSYIESVEIVKKKVSFTGTPDNYYGFNNFYAYFVAVKVKASSATSKYDVIGEITMKKTGQVKATSELVDGADFSFQVGYEQVTGSPSETTFTLTDGGKVYAFGTAAPKFAEDEEFEIYLYGDAGYFIVDTTGQGKLVIFNTTKFNSDVAALYPDANLDFVNGNGASFNKTGELYLYADEDTFLYALKADGTLAKVKAEYDEYEEAWVVKTRTLGSYVISDAELNLAPAAVEPATPAEPANPGTGAAA